MGILILRYHVKFDWNMGSLKGRESYGDGVVLAVRGELTIGVDLASADLTDIDDAGRRAVLVLPEPTLLEARVDHARSRVAAIRSDGLWKVLPAAPPSTPA